MMEISRRDFLIFLGVSGALAGGVSQVWSIPDDWEDRLASGPRVETWKASTCTRCPGGCGIRVRLVDGIPVRIHGNPIAPVNKGSLCPMGEAGLELLYHPDRIKQPMRRRGKKGESSWETISWAEASKQMAQSLTALQASKQQDKFGFLMGDRNTKLTEFAGLFTSGFGSPHFMPWHSPAINELGMRQAFGETKPLSIDLTRTDYLLTFGTNLLEEPPSPTFFNRIYGLMKEKRSQSGLKMVHVDARMSQAGRNATEWVQIRPGTMGSFAMGIAFVLIRDKNYDQDFITRHSKEFGVEGKGFLELVTSEFSPEKVASITGIPVSTILRVAREFGSAKAPIALSGGSGDASETSVFSQWAVASLNALKGGFSSKGLWHEAARLPGDPPAPSSSKTDDAPDAWAEKTTSLQVLMIGQIDPIYQAVNTKQWKDSLSRIGFVVQFATLLDETSPYVDLVLPLPTYLEQWDLTLPVDMLPFSQAGLLQPVVQPFGEGRPMGDVLLHLGTALGLSLLPGTERTSYEEYVQVQAQKVFASGRGTPFFEEVSLEFLESLRKRGWQAYSYPAFPDFWRLLQDKGGWWDPAGNPEMNWSTGRSFLFPDRHNLEALLDQRKAVVPGAQGSPVLSASSSWNKGPIEQPDAKDSFILVPFWTLMNMDGTGAGEPLLQEMFGLHMREYWHTWAELHPKRAEALGIQDGDLIRITTGGGACSLRAKVVPTVSPSIVAVPCGQGHSELGRYAKNIGINPIGLLDAKVDPLSGRHSWLSTLVRVERIGN